MDYFLFIFSAVGITSVLTISSLFSKPRLFIESKSIFLGELINCPMCTGFWVGFIVSLIAGNINPVYGGAMASFFSWMMISLVELTQLKAQVLSHELDVLIAEENGESE